MGVLPKFIYIVDDDAYAMRIRMRSQQKKIRFSRSYRCNLALTMAEKKGEKYRMGFVCFIQCSDVFRSARMQTWHGWMLADDFKQTSKICKARRRRRIRRVQNPHYRLPRTRIKFVISISFPLNIQKKNNLSKKWRINP